MSAHTRGSWHVDAPGDGLRVLSDHGTIICHVSGAMTNPSVIADAKLIAASPDLYRALQAMLTHMGMDEDEWNRPTFEQARAAIAKATGDT